MTTNPIPAGDIPHWYLEAVRVMREVDRELRNMETELRYGVSLKGLDPGLRDDMQFLLDSVGATQISLSVMDITASRVLSDLARSEAQEGRSARALGAFAVRLLLV